MKKSILLILATLVLFMSIATVSAEFVDLGVEIAHSDRIILDNGNSQNGGRVPNTHILHLRVKNNAVDNYANNVQLNFAWDDNDESEFTLIDTPNKLIDNIAPGETVDVFYQVLAKLPNGNGNNDLKRSYTIDIVGSNANPILPIKGTLTKVGSSVTGNSLEIKGLNRINADNPNKDEYVIFELTYQIKPGNALWITPYIDFNSSNLKLINVTTINNLKQLVYSTIVNGSMVDGEIFTTTWTFKVINTEETTVRFAVFAGNGENGNGQHLARYGGPIEINAKNPEPEPEDDDDDDDKDKDKNKDRDRDKDKNKDRDRDRDKERDKNKDNPKDDDDDEDPEDDEPKEEDLKPEDPKPEVPESKDPENEQSNELNSQILMSSVRNNYTPENNAEDDDSTDLTPIVLAESDDDDVVVIENIPSETPTEDTTDNTIEARATVDQVPMQKTALPIAILILVLLAICGITIHKIKQLK